MTASHASILQEIETGRRVWSVGEHTAEACDHFEAEVVVPMLGLAAEGVLKIVEERRKPIPSRYRVTYLRIKLPSETVG